MKDEPPNNHDGTRDDFLTARQLAAILQVSESTVRRLAREGRVPCVRITPRILRFNLKAVRQTLDGTTRARSSRRPASDEEKEAAQLSFTDLL